MQQNEIPFETDDSLESYTRYLTIPGFCNEHGLTLTLDDITKLVVLVRERASLLNILSGEVPNDVTGMTESFPEYLILQLYMTQIKPSLQYDP